MYLFQTRNTKEKKKIIEQSVKFEPSVPKWKKSLHYSKVTQIFFVGNWKTLINEALAWILYKA